MATEPRTPADHYQAAERLLDAAESSVTESIQIADALIGIGYAILAGAPRRARRRPPEPGRYVTGGSPRQRWELGTDDTNGGDPR
jgi:hypothetical protein